MSTGESSGAPLSPAQIAELLGATDDMGFRAAWNAMSPFTRELYPAGYARYARVKANGSDRLEHAAQHRLIDWASLQGIPPPFAWLQQHWLSWHPTLLAGRGGIGKSLLIQQVGTALSCGLPTWCPAVDPVRVLYWACEDDTDQLWRRQEAICASLSITKAELDRFHVDPRYGMENTLMSSEYGKPMWTMQVETLRQQLNDFRIDVLCLDNLGHTFGANENDRHHVTQFLNGIAGLVEGRRFCPIFLGHPSKAMNSEYSGSTAWENAVRMRWYLDDKLPDQTADPNDKPDQDYRFLSKRKTNYTRLDYVEFKFESGVLVPQQQESGDPGIIRYLRAKRAKTVVTNAVKQLAEVGIYGNDSFGRIHLPKVILENKLGESITKAELAEAMRELVLEKELIHVEILNASRHRISVLKLKG